MPVKGYLPEKHLETQHPGFLLEAGHTGSLCLVHTYRRLPAGRQVFSINHISCIISLGTVSRSYHLWEWWEPSCNPSSQMPVKSQPCKRAFQRRAVRLLFYPLFCTKGQMVWKISSVAVVQTPPWAIQMKDLIYRDRAGSGLAKAIGPWPSSFQSLPPTLGNGSQQGQS